MAAFEGIDFLSICTIDCFEWIFEIFPCSQRIRLAISSGSVQGCSVGVSGSGCGLCLL